MLDETDIAEFAMTVFGDYRTTVAYGQVATPVTACAGLVSHWSWHSAPGWHRTVHWPMQRTLHVALGAQSTMALRPIQASQVAPRSHTSVPPSPVPNAQRLPSSQCAAQEVSQAPEQIMVLGQTSGQGAASHAVVSHPHSPLGHRSAPSSTPASTAASTAASTTPLSRES
jgi:hypothetical protein